MEVVEARQRKFSKPAGQFLMVYPFFTGLYSMRGDNVYEVGEFTVCQVIDYLGFMRVVRSPGCEALREAWSNSP